VLEGTGYGEEGKGGKWKVEGGREKDEGNHFAKGKARILFNSL